MAAIELTDQNFRETYENNDILIIDFWAPWCGPCQGFLPTFEKVAQEFKDVVFGKVNTDTEHALAQHFSVRSVPTVMVIREGYELFYQPGALGEDDLRMLVTKVKELDMTEVRKQMDKEDGSES